jgi:hypothetical protein
LSIVMLSVAMLNVVTPHRDKCSSLFWVTTDNEKSFLGLIQAALL